MSIVYLNEKFIKQQDANISIMDRGLLFGDGVYEVLAVYNGKPFLLQEHLTRLENSLNAIHLTLDTKIFSTLPQIIKELVKLNDGGDQQIYLQVTRGAYDTRKHDLPAKITPTIFAFSMHNPFPDYGTLTRGVEAITLPDIRWQYCNIKAITLLPNILLNHQASMQNAQEAILIRNGCAIEGCASNVFIVKQETIITPPLYKHMLGGITRNLLVKLAASHQLPCEQREISVEELTNADEIWLTNSTREIRPVVKLDTQIINHGKPGKHWEKMYHLFQEYKQHHA